MPFFFAFGSEVRILARNGCLYILSSYSCLLFQVLIKFCYLNDKALALGMGE